jgi:UPF0755 protein
MKKIVIFSVSIIVFLVLLYFSFDILNDVYGIVKPYGKIEVDIKKGSSTAAIADTLSQNKIIKYPFFFRLYVKMNKQSGSSNYGVFEFNKDMGYKEIIEKLKEKSLENDTVKYTIPEGYTQTQIIGTIVSKGVSNDENFEKAIKSNDFTYDFLKDIPQRESRYEGYLFPDTYEVFKTEEPASALKRMLDNFEKKIKDNHIEEKAKAINMTLDQAVILASIIERETLKKDDLAIVSSVYHNRLKKGMKLQADITVLYALGSHKSYVTIADTKVESPYNTYYVTGLPKGPVCNPGIDALKAAVEPTQSDYYFYYSTQNGKIYFSKTYNEHLAIIKKYKGGTGTQTTE